MDPTDSRTAVRLVRIDAALRSRPLDQWMLAERVAICRSHLRQYVIYMLEQRLVHVVDWMRYGSGGPYIPVLAAGPGRSKPKPVPLTAAEKKKAYRKAVKSDPERYDRALKADRQRKRKVVATRDPLVAALFG